MRPHWDSDYRHWVDLDAPVSDDPDDGFQGISDPQVEAEIDRLRTRIAELEGKIRALGAWKINATEILFRLHVNEAADEQDIIDARALLDVG
jgi:hypothetical protein